MIDWTVARLCACERHACLNSARSSARACWLSQVATSILGSFVLPSSTFVGSTPMSRPPTQSSTFQFSLRCAISMTPSFHRATLCERGICRRNKQNLSSSVFIDLGVCLSLSQIGVLLKRLNGLGCFLSRRLPFTYPIHRVTRKFE